MSYLYHPIGGDGRGDPMRRSQICSNQKISTSIFFAIVGNLLDESQYSLVVEEFHADDADLLRRGDLPTLSRIAITGGV
ncbi:hypothetical protein Ddye_006543 [Dipteronia dyeriana]|uniref:Uncharacterized protein n=1 Tax=Dipteronia dyeriana TaxID=168575 RepID=A0AAE0CQM6_9ROSI|nr:hypothetical protein Ddye_006543 [Dipteronia dyeriana]